MDNLSVPSIELLNEMTDDDHMLIEDGMDSISR